MKSLPGSRQQIKRSRVDLASLLLVAVAVLVLLQEIAAEEALAGTRKWIGVGGGVTLLFGAVSLHIAREQWAASLFPLLTYMRRRRPDSQFALTTAGKKLWCVEVRNVGGLAIIDHVRYDIEMHGKPDSRRDDVAYEEMLKILESSTGASDEIDFVVVNWQGGFGIDHNDVTRLCEFPMPVVRQIKKLDAHVVYTSRFGGLYKHLVSVIPPRGLPRETPEDG
jgi:hypothetical protein